MMTSLSCWLNVKKVKKNAEQLIDLRIAAEPCCLKLVRSVIRDVADLAGLPEQERDNVVLAVHEACMNVIQHAYHNAPKEEIRLSVLRSQSALIFLLQDDAPCVDTESIRPRDLDQIRPGGLGVHFIRQIMDEVEFLECVVTGNTLKMVKYFQS